MGIAARSGHCRRRANWPGAAPSELYAERIKRLVTEGMPLLIVHPAFDSVLSYYEVDMTRRESGAVVQHYNPLMGNPVTLEVAGWICDGHPATGTIHQVSCERRVAVAARDEVLAHLARDVELLAAVAGDVRRVTAIGPTGEAASYASLQIQMNVAVAPSLRWSVGYAAAGATRLELALHGEHGIVTIRIADGASGGPPIWQIETGGNDVRNDQPLAAYDPARAAIAQLADAAGQSQLVERSSASTWDAATRAMEVVDAVDLSLQKGRTIEVFQQHLTERLAFRGTMAAMGCGLLLVAFFALVGVGMLGGAEGIVRQRLMPSWPLLLLAVLAFFLLLQTVPVLAGKPNSDLAESKPDRPDDRET